MRGLLNVLCTLGTIAAAVAVDILSSHSSPFSAVAAMASPITPDFERSEVIHAIVAGARSGRSSPASSTRPQYSQVAADIST